MNKIYDLVIKGGTVWTTSGPSETDVAVKNGIISVHNGIIANSEKLWKENTHLNRETDN